MRLLEPDTARAGSGPHHLLHLERLLGARHLPPNASLEQPLAGSRRVAVRPGLLGMSQADLDRDLLGVAEAPDPLVAPCHGFRS